MNETETYTVRICRECGALYSSTQGRMMHSKATGHTEFKNEKRTRALKPAVISYQPGYDTK